MRIQIGAGVRSADSAERRAFFRAEEEARMAPIKKAEAELSRTAGKVLKAEREAVLNGKDDQAVSLLSEAMKAITPERPMTLDEARQFNEREAIAFAESTPEFFRCEENAELITSYCARNQINVADAATYRNIFHRLDSLGLMQHAPVSHPEAVIEEQPVAAPAKAEAFEGVDESGRPKTYTAVEVDRMSADEYRRAFRLPTKQFIEYQEAGIRW